MLYNYFKLILHLKVRYFFRSIQKKKTLNYEDKNSYLLIKKTKKVNTVYII